MMDGLSSLKKALLRICVESNTEEEEEEERTWGPIPDNLEIEVHRLRPYYSPQAQSRGIQKSMSLKY